MSVAYCTVDDVRRVFQERDLSDVLAEDNNEPVIRAIQGVSEDVERRADKHWYLSSGLDEDTEGIIATSVQTRDDEHDIPTHGGYVDGAYGGEPYRATNTSNTVFSSQQTASPDPKQQIRLDRGDLDDDTIPAYTRIQLERKDVDAINSLNIANDDGGYDDWVASNDYDGGVGFDSHAGDDFYVRINSGGVSELYIDIHSLDDDVAYLSNAVVVGFDYGDEELPQDVRRGIGLLTASELVLDDEFATGVPDNGQLTNVETKAQRWERTGWEKLDYYLPDDDTE